MNTPFFSIIIHGYNKAKVLPRAIQSVINQQFTNWELCFVDDGSIDHTRDLLSTFKDSRIRYFYQSNQERSAARNHGIYQTKGRYVCFLESENYFLDDHLAALYRGIKSNNFEKAFYYTGLVEQDIEEIVPFKMSYNKYPHPVIFAFQNRIQSNASCIHRDLLYEDLFDERFMQWEDMHLWLRLLLKHPFVKIPGYTASIKAQSEDGLYNTIKKVYIDQVDNYLECIRDFHVKYGQEIEPYISKRTFRDFVHKKLAFTAHLALHNKQLKEAIKILFRMVRNKPIYMLNPRFSKLVFLTSFRFMTL